MQLSPIHAVKATRPLAAAYLHRQGEPEAGGPAESYAPGPPGDQPRPEPSALASLEIKTYVPRDGGYQEVSQYPALDDLGRPTMARNASGEAVFFFRSEEGLQSVTSGGKLNYTHPIEGKFGGFKVRPDGGAFLKDGDKVVALAPDGRVEATHAVPEGSSLLLSNDGHAWISTDKTLQKLGGGPELPLGGAAGRVAALSSGHTVVTEWQQGILRVFDPRGEEVKATPARVSNASLSPEGRLVYEADKTVHTYDVHTGQESSFQVGTYVKELLPLANGKLAVLTEKDLTRGDLRILTAEGQEERSFAIKDGCLMDLQETADGKSLLGTINRWDRKPSSTDLVRFDLEDQGLGARLGELLRNQHGQTILHTVPEREGLVAGALPDGGVVVVDKRGATVDGQFVGDQKALEARLGKGARLHASENLLEPVPADLDANFRRQLPIRQHAELGSFYRQQGATRAGTALEFPGEQLDQLPGQNWTGQGQAAMVKAILAVENDHALKEGVVPFGGPGGALVRTSAHELTVELPVGDGKFRSTTLVCDWESFEGGTHWEESWTHALPIQVGNRHYLCAANDKKQVFFFELDSPRNELKHLDLETPVRSMALKAGVAVVTTQDGSTLVIKPPQAPGETVYEGEPPGPEGGATRVIESNQRVQIGGVMVRKKRP